MQEGMAAFAHHDDACLDGFRLVDNLLRRMAYDDLRLQFNLFLTGALAQRRKTALVALTPVFENRVELRALGGFRRTDHRDDEQLGLQIPGHIQGNIQGMLGMRRRVKCNQYLLNANKSRASHELDYTSSTAIVGCVAGSDFLLLIAWGSRCRGKKNEFAIMVGITALAMTVPTMKEYCDGVMI